MEYWVLIQCFFVEQLWYRLSYQLMKISNAYYLLTVISIIYASISFIAIS